MGIHTIEKTGAIGMHSEREIPLTRDEIELILYRWWESLDRPLMTFEEWYYGSGGLKDALDSITPEDTFGRIAAAVRPERVGG